MANTIRLTSIKGNSQQLDGGAMFGNAPRTVWEKWIRPDSRGRIPLACRALLIETPGRKILCETGIGNFFEPKMRDRFGVQGDGHVLLKNLALHCIPPDQITDVILSHLHFDHAGGLLSSYEDGPLQIAFPKAKIFVGEEAWKRAQNPHPRDRASFIPALTQLLTQNPMLHVIPKGATSSKELPSFISFRFTEGHTPGHMHTVIQGENNRMIFAGDLIPGRPWVHVPITMGYDRFPERLIDEKELLLSEWAQHGDWVFFTHDSEVAAAVITARDGKYVPDENLTKLENIAF